MHRGKKFCPEVNWKDVRAHIKEHGMRNSNTMAIAPTATISYIQGCSPSVENQTSPRYLFMKINLATLFISNEWFVKECKDLEPMDSFSLIETLKAVNGDVSATKRRAYHKS